MSNLLGPDEALVFSVLAAIADGLSRFTRSDVRTAAIWEKQGGTGVFDPFGLIGSERLPPSMMSLEVSHQGTHFDIAERLVCVKARYDELHGGIGTLFVLADQPRGLMRGEHLTTWLRLALSSLIADLGSLEGSTPGASKQKEVEHLARTIVTSTLSAGMETSINTVDAVSNALELAEELSLQQEEGASIRGTIAFPPDLSPELDVQIQEASDPLDYKLLGKLVIAGGDEHDLVIAPPTRVLGYRRRRRDRNDVILELRASGEAVLRRGDVLHATYKSGRLSAKCRETELGAVEVCVRIFLQRVGGNDRLPGFLRRVLSRVAGGASVVIGGEAHRLGLGFQDPLPCRGEGTEDLAAAMSVVDGALSFAPNGALLGFGCLLDGPAAPNESRARGSRFNSAVRYTIDKPDTLAIVLSSDGFASVIEGGRQLYPSRPFRGRVPSEGFQDLDVYEQSHLRFSE